MNLVLFLLALTAIATAQTVNIVVSLKHQLWYLTPRVNGLGQIVGTLSNDPYAFNLNANEPTVSIDMEGDTYYFQYSLSKVVFLPTSKTIPTEDNVLIANAWVTSLGFLAIAQDNHPPDADSKHALMYFIKSILTTSTATSSSTPITSATTTANGSPAGGVCRQAQAVLF